MEVLLRECVPVEGKGLVQPGARRSCGKKGLASSPFLWRWETHRERVEGEGNISNRDVNRSLES